MTKKRAPIRKRVEALAAQAYLMAQYFDQGHEDGVREMVLEMTEALEEDKKLAQYLYPGLIKLCQEKNLEVHGHHVKKAEKH